MLIKRMSLVLLAMATAGCADVGYSQGNGGRGDDRSARWQQRYSRTYSYNDDIYYRECRNSPDPAGVIAGALIGGLLGNAIGQGGGRTGGTIAGVIVGGRSGRP
ncbi:MAG: hypothetical protein ACXWKT_04040 [Caulobacteraceae bacterium]